MRDVILALAECTSSLSQFLLLLRGASCLFFRQVMMLSAGACCGTGAGSRAASGDNSSEATSPFCTDINGSNFSTLPSLTAIPSRTSSVSPFTR